MNNKNGNTMTAVAFRSMAEAACKTFAQSGDISKAVEGLAVAAGLIDGTVEDFRSFLSEVAGRVKELRTFDWMIEDSNLTRDEWNDAYSIRLRLFALLLSDLGKVSRLAEETRVIPSVFEQNGIDGKTVAQAGVFGPLEVKAGADGEGQVARGLGDDDGDDQAA